MDWQQLLVMLALILVSICLGVMIQAHWRIYDGYSLQLVKPNSYAKVAGTGSMYPFLPNDVLLELEDFNGNLLCGHVYTYIDFKNKSIVHRFVYEDSEGMLYFKGDNNEYIDHPITIDQIDKHVVGIRYD